MCYRNTQLKEGFPLAIPYYCCNGCGVIISFFWFLELFKTLILNIALFFSWSFGFLFLKILYCEVYTLHYFGVNNDTMKFLCPPLPISFLHDLFVSLPIQLLTLYILMVTSHCQYPKEKLLCTIWKIFELFTYKVTCIIRTLKNIQDHLSIFK